MMPWNLTQEWIENGEQQWVWSNDVGVLCFVYRINNKNKMGILCLWGLVADTWRWGSVLLLPLSRVWVWWRHWISRNERYKVRPLKTQSKMKENNDTSYKFKHCFFFFTSNLNISLKTLLFLSFITSYFIFYILLMYSLSHSSTSIFFQHGKTRNYNRCHVPLLGLITKRV